jgi:hypothetical protein
MVPYFKTQLWRLAMALFCIVCSIVIICTSTAEATSFEGTYLLLRDVIDSTVWILSGLFWLIMSMIDHNEDCIRELNKRVTELEKKAITDIVIDSDYQVNALRKLGPDKNVE